jgi:leucine dehydrogenase
VINGGGIIAVALEYLAREQGHPCSLDEVNARIEQIPVRLAAIWDESSASGLPSDQVADAMAQKLIGR